MRNLRNAMFVAVVAATALAAIAGFFLGGPPSRLLVDAGLAMALVVIVGVMLSPTVARTDMLVEALRALARGDRHQRVDPDQFAGLGDVARAANEVAASLSEGEDPNLGPIKSVPRPGASRAARAVDAPRREAPPPGVEPSEHPEIGQVRVLKKADGNGEAKSPFEPQKTRVLSAPPESTSSPPLASAPVTASPSPSPPGPNMSAPTNDTNIDDAPRSDIRSAESDPPRVPSRSELEVLFQEFAAAKKSHDEAVADLDVDAFAQTILGECERLIAAHRCKGVRFEVTMQDGEVSLRPRLLR